ncbi:MAG TPA: class I SAM-dependent methyltransferase [Gaiellaceae bacterium]|jgi:SAM-dependent methyltransferase
MPLNDPDVVRTQYEHERNLRARQALYEESEGSDPREVAWNAITEADPHRVLEVGGGPGEVSERMMLELGADVSFVDISPRMVELARARGIADARVGDVQELPFEDETFDTAVAAWMLYHVPDIDRALAELARVLLPGGRLVAVTNAFEHLHELRELVGWRPSDFESVFNRANGAELLGRHFDLVEQRDVDGWVTIRDRQKIVAYRNSLSGVDQLGDLRDFGVPLRIRRANTVFVATK